MALPGEGGTNGSFGFPQGFVGESSFNAQAPEGLRCLLKVTGGPPARRAYASERGLRHFMELWMGDPLDPGSERAGRTGRG
jgi:hypothetical protein